MLLALRYRLFFGLSLLCTSVFFTTANASVIAQLQGTQLHIIGDSQDNSITVTADTDLITVTSTDTNPVSVMSFSSAKVKRVNVGTRGGNDEVVLTSLVQPGLAGKKAIELEVMAGHGDDVVQINGYWAKTRVHGAAGSDTVEIGSAVSGTEFDGKLTIDTGQGTDSIALDGVTVQDKTKIHSGAGGDTVSVMGSNFVGRFHLHTGGGNDEVSFLGNTKVATVPYILRGGGGIEDSLTGQFDLAEMNISGFEQIVQIPDDPILITAIDRSTFARTSYSSDYGPPPDNVIAELEENALNTDQAGPWDGSVNASILDSFGAIAPITASASHISDVGTSGGTLDIDLFSDQYWGSQPFGHLPFGSARSSSGYEVTFVANDDLTLTVDGFLSTNRASAGYPKGFASFRIIERGPTDVTLVQRIVSPVSDILFNDLVETLDGTVVALESGKTYSIVIVTTGNSAATTSPDNSEAEVSLIWNIN